MSKLEPGQRVLRCAIYTRKSTDHHLERDFNSLESKRQVLPSIDCERSRQDAALLQQ